jgi:hypothetical protein
LKKSGSHKFFAKRLICDDICSPFYTVVSVRKDDLPCVCGLWLLNCAVLLRSTSVPTMTLLIFGPAVCYRRSLSWFCIVTPTLLLNMCGDSGREFDHSPPFRAEVKNEWSFTCTAHTCLQDVDGVNFTFLFSNSRKMMRHFPKLYYLLFPVNPVQLIVCNVF